MSRQSEDLQGDHDLHRSFLQSIHRAVDNGLRPNPTPPADHVVPLPNPALRGVTRLYCAEAAERATTATNRLPTDPDTELHAPAKEDHRNRKQAVVHAIETYLAQRETAEINADTARAPTGPPEGMCSRRVTAGR
jgi:hypothetical protein